MSAWVLVIAGVLILLVAQRIPPPKNPASIRLRGVVGILGAGVLIIGGYSGLKGPVSFNGITFRAFSFAHAGQKRDLAALNYAKTYVRISSRPAAAWRGSSKTALTCNVINGGDRQLTTLTFTFVTTDHRGVQIRVRGPYPPNTTKSVFVELPDNVVRAYFENGMSASQIYSASF